MKKSVAVVALTCAGVLAVPTMAQATEPETIEMSWWMEGSVNGETTWPQPVAAGQCGWFQVDTYHYGTPEQKAIVDALDDDGVLSLINGTPEDSRVYKSHYYKEVPCVTETPTPTPTDSSSSEPTPTQEPTSTPSTEPSSTPIPPSPEPPSTTFTSEIGTPTTLASTGPSDPRLWLAAVIASVSGTLLYVIGRRKRASAH